MRTALKKRLVDGQGRTDQAQLSRVPPFRFFMHVDGPCAWRFPVKRI